MTVTPLCAYCGAPTPRKRSKYCSQRCMGLDRKKAIEVTCPCGTVFEAQPNVFSKPGCGRYCSKRCMYKYRVRPSGLKYNLVKDNPTSFRPGERRNPEGEFKPGQTLGPANVRWIGDAVGYDGLHDRVHVRRGKAANYPCAHADETCKGPMHWANISHEYKGVDDFMPLCQSHHIRYDRASGTWGRSRQGWPKPRGERE